MSVSYDYRGLKVFLDGYFFTDSVIKKVSSVLSSAYPPREGSAYPFDVSEHYTDPLFAIVCDCEVDGWDVVRHFHVRLPSLSVAETIADIVGGWARAESDEVSYGTLDEYELSSAGRG